MKLSRRFQHLPDYWYCVDPDCYDNPLAGGLGPASAAESGDHARDTGHETRCRVTREIIWTRPALEAVDAR
jgi:hypothetical protein